MSRRSTRTIKTIANHTAEESKIVKPTTPKKATKAKPIVKEELESIDNPVGKFVNSVKPATKITKKAVVKKEATLEAPEEKTPEKKTAKHSCKPEPKEIDKFSEETKLEPKSSTATKRKTTKEENGASAPKKRKTKEEKEAEAMPLAARTAVSSLKKAMYIGAHVSGAGGAFTCSQA